MLKDTDALPKCCRKADPPGDSERDSERLRRLPFILRASRKQMAEWDCFCDVVEDPLNIRARAEGRDHAIKFFS